jgi:FMN phosphatase YigB (HAD superfamily)
MWRNIFLDFDGTLHDTESVFASELDGLFGLEGRTLYNIYMFDIHRQIVHYKYPERHDDAELHWKLLLEYLKIPYSRKKANLLTLRFKEAEESVFENPKIFPDVPFFLNKLAECGHHLCLSTGGGTSLRKGELLAEALGKNYLDDILGEEVIGQLKNTPSYYEEALKIQGWSSEGTVSIGDTIFTDVIPAKTIGIGTIWINRYDRDLPDETAINPDYEVSDLTSALKYLLH